MKRFYMSVSAFGLCVKDKPTWDIWGVTFKGKG
jgi:hypothetical protein